MKRAPIPPKKEGFADDRQVGNPVWVLTLIFLLTLAVLSVAGCAEPQTRYSLIDGVVVTEHIDQESPCGYRGPAVGCSSGRDIWYSSVSPSYVRKHEIGHQQGMHHGEWKYDQMRKMVCATVIAGTPDYPLGSEICNNGKREFVFLEESK